MLVYDMVENLLLVRPDARAVFLATDLWWRHAEEQADELLADGHDPASIAFYVAGVRVLHDPALPYGAADCAAWPEGVGSQDDAAACS